jgi:hypothetical protein
MSLYAEHAQTAIDDLGTQSLYVGFVRSACQRHSALVPTSRLFAGNPAKSLGAQFLKHISLYCVKSERRLKPTKATALIQPQARLSLASLAHCFVHC